MDRSDIRRGMRVRGHDGLSLGRVIGVCSDSFLGRTSFLLGRRYRFAFGDIESVTDGTLRLRYLNGGATVPSRDLSNWAQFVGASLGLRWSPIRHDE